MTRQEIIQIVNSEQFIHRLFTRFLQYFSIWYEFQDIELPPHYLPNDISYLLNQNFSYIVKDFLDNQQYDIIELINSIDNTADKTDINFFRENKNNIYYPVENILLDFINLPIYCNKLKATISKVIKEKNDNKVNALTNGNITYEKLKQRISNLICGNIYPKLAKFVPQIKLRTSIHNQLATLINSFNIDDKFCQENFNLSFNQLNDIFNFSSYQTLNFVNYKDWTELYNYTVDLFDSVNISDRNKYLLELDNDDKIGQLYGEIDYEPHNVSLRNGPIVIYRNNDTKEDKVLIGEYGDYHSDLVSQMANSDKAYFGRGYWYKPCAFIDGDHLIGYSIDELAKILKADPRIKKVYLTPSSRNGKLKRLAKRL